MTVRRQALIYTIVALIALGGFVLSSAMLFRPGFPLDDAWIHQTYARNWVRTGEWDFQRGVPSAGSTAPLWSALLGAGYLLRIAPLVWSAFLGVLALAGLGLVAASGVRRMAPARPGWAFWGGLLVLLEWHLVWAAGSGMETLAYALIVTAVLVHLLRPPVRAGSTGLLIGLAVWLRPEGLTLLGPALFVIWMEGSSSGREKSAGTLRVLAGALLLVIPYLGFNRALSGQIWPSTFFAKQAEYAVLRAAPFSSRFAAQLGIPLVGVGAALLPWLLHGAAGHWKSRNWGALGGLLWLLGTAWLYAWRLPVTYQHGRYLIPVIPVWLIWGFAGLAAGVRLGSAHFWPRVVGRASVLLCAALLLVFYLLGARAYARDVAVIESEMVDTARWVSANTEPDALVAAHDIGALGYFGDRALLDLAGLVSPQVIPIIRDEEALEMMIDSSEADYFVTLQGWYATLESDLELVFISEAPYSPAMGGSNMAVYRWRSKAP